MIKKLLITWGDHVYEMEEETQAQVWIILNVLASVGIS